MIRYSDGDIFASGAMALVNPVNCQGVMGAGLAKEFLARFPEASEAYRHACKVGALWTGRLHVFEYRGRPGPKWIIHLPTKHVWRLPSRLEYVTWGLQRLAATIDRLQIPSIAVPALGCGKGGLAWPDVREEIIRRLGAIDGVEVLVFPPPLGDLQS